jgi:hypothetical protein
MRLGKDTPHSGFSPGRTAGRALPPNSPSAAFGEWRQQVSQQTTSRSFDELASGLASSNISRGKALKSWYGREWRGDWREQSLIVGSGVVYASVTLLLVFG